MLVGAIFDVGGANPLNLDLRGIQRIGLLLGPSHPAPPENLREVIARYLYLNAVLDQGRDSVGVGLLLARVLNHLDVDLGMSLLDDPLAFFAQLEGVIRIIEEEHQQVKSIRGPVFPRISAYSLYGDTYRVTPWVAFRWGSPLGNIHRFSSGTGGLLAWLNGFESGENMAIAVKQDRLYGLGGAIGEKASRLFAKWVAFSARLSPAWERNSYEVPLDANVGRVLMRTGYIFSFLDQEDMQRGSPKPWTLQESGQVNLSAQSLNDRPLRRVEPIQQNLSDLLSRWGLSASRSNFRIMKTLNVLLARSRGSEAPVGQLDDGFMRVGRDFCFNSNPNCEECPLRTVCLANTRLPQLKTVFYCGTGSGVFY